MTDSAGPTPSQTPGRDRGDERLAREEELAQLGLRPRPGTGSAWPVATVVLLTIAAWVPVVLTFLRVGIDPAPFAFRTDNVFWVLTTHGAPATMMLAAGAAGTHPRAAGSGVLRVAAAVVTGAQLVVLGVIAVLQVLWVARPVIMAQTVFTIVAVALAAGAVALALVAARADRRGFVTTWPARAPLAGLSCVLVGQVVLTVGATAQLPGAVGIYVASLLIGALTAVGMLTGLWLTCRGRPGPGWTGAAILCLLAVVSLGSLPGVFASADLPPAHRLVQAAQYLLFASGAITALLAARAAMTPRPAPAPRKARAAA